MASMLLSPGLDGLSDVDDWDTDNYSAMLVGSSTTDTAIKTITGATNATPIVITATAHGFANGDIVCIRAVGGNLAANGVFRVANQAANTFEITDPISGSNVVGSAAYTSGGQAICLGTGTVGDNLDDYSAARVGTDQALASKTIVNGIYQCTSPISWPSGGGVEVIAILVYRNTGSEATSRAFAWLDGRHIVTCAAQAAASATSVAVERLEAGIPNGTVLTFSNGASATLSALANAGDRTISVNALAAIITAGSRADAPATGAGLPVTNSGAVNYTVDATNGIGRIQRIA